MSRLEVVRTELEACVCSGECQAARGLAESSHNGGLSCRGRAAEGAVHSGVVRLSGQRCEQVEAARYELDGT